MKIVALVVKVLKLHFVENGAVDKLLSAEPVVDDRAGFEILHARLHGPALVAGRAVFRAEHGEKLALVLDDHAGAKLCGLDAAHCLFAAAMRPTAPWNVSISEIQAGLQCGRIRNDTRHAEKKLQLSANIQYKWADSTRSIVALSGFLRALRRGCGHELLNFISVAWQPLAQQLVAGFRDQNVVFDAHAEILFRDVNARLNS